MSRNAAAVGIRLRMTSRLLALATLAACGEVVKDNPDAPPSDAPAGSVVYRGMVQELPPVMFGGMGFCTWTITLKQIETQILVLPSGAIVGGSSQNLNVEQIVATTPPCADPPLAPSIAKYSFESARSTPPGITVEFKSAPENMPPATLTMIVQRAGEQYMTDFRYHRTDFGPPIEWNITGSMMLLR